MRAVTIRENDFQKRRERFLKALKNGVCVLPSATELIRNNDVHHPFRQESNFFYLTGFEEPHAICLLAPQHANPFQLFVQPKDKTRELWEGKIWGPDAAKSKFGADASYASTPESHFDDAFVEALILSERLFYRVGHDAEMDKRIFRLMAIARRKIGRSGRSQWPILDPLELLGEMRLYKSPAEIDRLRQAAAITAEAHTNAMKMAKPGLFEYEIEAVLHHSFRVGGAARSGYGSIVASGANACTLHYVSNSRKMSSGDLLLVDAGAEFEYYTADITRTFPVGAGFSPEQREVYASVLETQKECLKLARPGKSLKEIHACAVEVLVENLRRMKVLKGPTQSLIKKKAYLPYYPHGTGHWLGMDVHDVGVYYHGDYEVPRKFEPGMVFTVEPGLYFSNDSHVPARFRGIGVRIEDDVLVTTNGCDILTVNAPKEIEELEAIGTNA